MTRKALLIRIKGIPIDPYNLPQTHSEALSKGLPYYWPGPGFKCPRGHQGAPQDAQTDRCTACTGNYQVVHYETDVVEDKEARYLDRVLDEEDRTSRGYPTREPPQRGYGLQKDHR